MDTMNYQAEQQYIAAERDLAVRELMGEEDEVIEQEVNDCPHDHVTDDTCDDCGAILEPE